MITSTSGTSRVTLKGKLIEFTFVYTGSFRCVCHLLMTRSCLVQWIVLFVCGIWGHLTAMYVLPRIKVYYLSFCCYSSSISCLMSKQQSSIGSAFRMISRLSVTVSNLQVFPWYLSKNEGNYCVKMKPFGLFHRNCANFFGFINKCRRISSKCNKILGFRCHFPKIGRLSGFTSWLEKYWINIGR